MDIDHNGTIDDNDKVMIGDPNPDFRLGFGLNMTYKGLDFSITANGAFGQQIFKFYRHGLNSRWDNFTTDIFGRWHGEGTSNKLPRLTETSNVNWQKISDIYVENGDYLKIQSITLGYDFKKLFPGMPLQQARIYVTGSEFAYHYRIQWS